MSNNVISKEYGWYLWQKADDASEKAKQESFFDKYSPIVIVAGFAIIAASLACGFKFGHLAQASSAGLDTAGLLSLTAITIIAIIASHKYAHDRARSLILAGGHAKELEAYVLNREDKENAQMAGLTYLAKHWERESFSIRHPWMSSALYILGSLAVITLGSMLLQGGPKHLFTVLKKGIREWKTMLAISGSMLGGVLVIKGLVDLCFRKTKESLEIPGEARFRAGLLKLSAIMASLVALGLGLYFGHLSLAAKEGIIFGATAGAASIGLYYAVTKLSEKHLRWGALAIIFFGGLMLASYLAHAYGVNTGEKIKEGVMTLLHGGYNQALLHFIKTQGFAMAETAGAVVGGFLMGHQIYHVKGNK